MARLLAYNTPATGHILPATGMLLELRRRGHDVHVRTRGSDVERLRGLGLHASAIDPRIEAIEFDDGDARNQIEALLRVQRTFIARGEFEIPDLQRAIDDINPDALIIDVSCEGAGCVAEASGLPFAYHCPFPPVFPSKDAPPYGPGWRPARGPLGRGRDRVATAVVGRLGKRVLAPLNVMRARFGLEPVTRLDEHYLRAHRFLLFTAEPYEYTRTDWPEQVRLVGPGDWEPPSDAPQWLGGETQPMVLVAASTIRQRDDRLVVTALKALAGENFAVIATTGAHDPTTFKPPANARVERFVAHGLILQRAACVVCHGGQGITQKALAAGVPVVVVPFCRDQFEVARRVEVCGAGTRLHHKRLTPSRLRKSVHAAIAMRHAAKQVASGFARAGGSAAAADAIEELLCPATSTA
jgi:MGT family glycosyltransferase